MKSAVSVSRRGFLSLSAAGLAALGGALALAGGCSEDEKKAPDRSAVLVSTVDAVILPSFEALRSQAAALAAALDALAAQPSAATLEAARASWGAARGAYRQTVAFGIGPSDDIAVTGGAIDEPCDQAKLDELLALDPPADDAKVRSSPASTRGFLAIEALLFAVDTPADKVLEGYTSGAQSAGRAALLRALGADLRDKLVAVCDGWAPGKGGYGDQVKTAGKGSTAYQAQRDAFSALLNQALTVADRMLNIARRSAGAAPDDLKSPVADRSDRTLADLADDLKGIENLYTGQREGKGGASVSSIVVEASAGADQAMLGAMAGAKAALASFGPPLRGAVPARQAEFDALIEKMKAVKTALSAQVFNALGVTVGISDKDGD